MAVIGKDLQRAIALLTAGELVAIPTETVYGLAGNALDPLAVAKIFEVKERPSFDPLIVHVPDLSHAYQYATTFPEKAIQLAEKFWPGPLTLVVSRKAIIPDLVTSGLDTVGLRCPDHAVTLHLLKQLTFPLAAPSANPFGYVSPTRPEHVNDQLGKKIGYILDGGASQIGIESTIVGFENNDPVIYRVGGLSIHDIESAVGTTKKRTHSSSNPKAPGQLKSHYAPTKKIVIGEISRLIRETNKQTTGVLSFQKDYQMPFQYILSTRGDTREAAQNLFTALRELDKMEIDQIITEWAPDEGLGAAINDRLARAAANRD